MRKSFRISHNFLGKPLGILVSVMQPDPLFNSYLKVSQKRKTFLKEDKKTSNTELYSLGSFFIFHLYEVSLNHLQYMSTFRS